MIETVGEHEVVQNEAPDSETLTYPVVGIGASAGGIEACIDLLHNLPLHTGMAFVLVPHLGEGFDREECVQGLGLLSMAERAHLVGGTLDIKSELGRGTSVTVSVPLVSPREIES